MSMYTPVVFTLALESEFIFIITAAIYVKDDGLATCYHCAMKCSATRLEKGKRILSVD